MKVAVYGTLKQGGALHAHMNGMKYLETKMYTGYEMYKVTGAFYPAVVPSPDCPFCTITVEVYEGDEGDLHNLDLVEGFNEDDPETSLYVRQKMNDGAWLYIAGPWLNVDEHRRIPEGDFYVG